MEFPKATKHEVYTLSGHEGRYVKTKYSQAKDLPEGIRAIIGNRICWFVPEDSYKYELLDELVDLSGEDAILDLVGPDIK